MPLANRTRHYFATLPRRQICLPAQRRTAERVSLRYSQFSIPAPATRAPPYCEPQQIPSLTAVSF